MCVVIHQMCFALKRKVKIHCQVNIKSTDSCPGGFESPVQVNVLPVKMLPLPKVPCEQVENVKWIWIESIEEVFLSLLAQSLKTTSIPSELISSRWKW